MPSNLIFFFRHVFVLYNFAYAGLVELRLCKVRDATNGLKFSFIKLNHHTKRLVGLGALSLRIILIKLISLVNIVSVLHCKLLQDFRRWCSYLRKINGDSIVFLPLCKLTRLYTEHVMFVYKKSRNKCVSWNAWWHNLTFFVSFFFFSTYPYHYF